VTKRLHINFSSLLYVQFNLFFNVSCMMPMHAYMYAQYRWNKQLLQEAVFETKDSRQQKCMHIEVILLTVIVVDYCYN